jgi:hypothetical protein
MNQYFGMSLENYQKTIMDWLATTIYKIGKQATTKEDEDWANMR